MGRIQMSLNDWEDALYDKIFNETLAKLRYQKDHAFSQSLKDIKDTLQSLYVLDGNNWLGRGVVGDITSAATIAAYELFINEWESME